MGKNWGMVKYMLKAPVNSPIDFFKYGGGFAGTLAAYSALMQHPETLDAFVQAIIAYLSLKYLPPTSPLDVLLPIVFGAVLAGLKWRIKYELKEP